MCINSQSKIFISIFLSLIMSFLSSFINLDSPLSLYSIPVVWFTSFYPAALRVRVFLLHNQRCMKFHVSIRPLQSKKLLDTTSASKILAGGFIMNANIYRSVQPRANIAKVVNNENISRDVAARIQRMEGAHLNGNEAFPLWVAAIVGVIRCL